jgi:hypothetical protein
MDAEHGELTMSGSIAMPLAPARKLTLLQADRDEFRQCFGVSAFALQHSMVGDPLFSLPRLAKAAERCSDRFFVAGGLTNRNASWSDMQRKRLVAGAVEELQDSHSWMKISNVGGSDPDYLDVQRAFLEEVQELSGRPILSEVTWSSLTVFLASPNVVTPLHVDHGMNCLHQIAGEKDVCFFDPTDRELLPDAEIERFYFGQVTGLRFPEHLQQRGKIFRLTPGVAVHHPSLAAHWVKNGPNVSISVAIGFCLRDIDRRARIYQVNYCLRQVGLRPRPPGRSAIVDSLKAATMGLLGVRLRKPKTYNEVVYAGPDRLKAPFRLVKRLVSRAGATGNGA